MANSITGNPIYIDSVGTLFKQRFKFDGGLWTSTAAGDTIVLTDNDGRVVFKSLYPTDLQPVTIPKMNWINGLIVTTITAGGYAVIYIGK
jgi:hypothetical protein